MSSSLSEKLFLEAQRLIPGGVNSPVRAWRAVGGTPRFIQRGKGAELVDVDGRVYVDFVCSWGAMVAGHGHPQVLKAVAEALKRGTHFGAPTPQEVELAQEVTRRFPAIQKLRLVSSGTEAAMSAVRLARGFTGRDKIVKFAGCYHGHSDGLLVRAGSGFLTFGVPDSPGVPAPVAGLTLVAEFNDPAQVEALLSERASEIAAVLVEPVPANMGVVPPVGDFLGRLRELTHRHGVVLIFDEVITGFRLGSGGAQQRFGIAPDLTCLGKILGGGLPLAAFGGRSDIMAHLAPDGGVYQAGTLSGNPLAVAAGLATVGLLCERAYGDLEALGVQAQEGLERALQDSGVPGCVQRAGSMLTLFLGRPSVRNFAEARACDGALFARYFHGMLERQVYLPPSQFEAMFLSLAHTSDHVEQLVRAAREVLTAIAKAG